MRDDRIRPRAVPQSKGSLLGTARGFHPPQLRPRRPRAVFFQNGTALCGTRSRLRVAPGPAWRRTPGPAASVCHGERAACAWIAAWASARAHAGCGRAAGRSSGLVSPRKCLPRNCPGAVCAQPAAHGRPWSPEKQKAGQRPAFVATLTSTRSPCIDAPAPGLGALARTRRHGAALQRSASGEHPLLDRGPLPCRRAGDCAPRHGRRAACLYRASPPAPPATGWWSRRGGDRCPQLWPVRGRGSAVCTAAA
jgi:hypothetical protein